MARNSLIAVILLVVLRLAIGWQLLYEGLWKLNTQDTARPWTSSGYLKNSEGPLRDTFRTMAGDPDDLDWLNYDIVAARWDDWAERFRSNYNLSEKQASSLNRILNGSAGKVGDRRVYASDELAQLPELPEPPEDDREWTDEEKFAKATGVSSKIAWYDPEKKLLYVDGVRHLTQSERDKLLRLVAEKDDDVSNAYRKAVNTVYARQKRGIGYKEKLAGAVKGNPDLLGNEAWQRVGQKKEYEIQLARYQKQRKAAETSFEWDHMGSDWKKIQALRVEITAPVKALEKEFQDKAIKLLTLKQMGQAPESKPFTALRLADLSTMWGLTILGLLLISGLFTRFAAVAAAFMLLGFYMAMPPFPGVPELPGPEHSFIVNKNLIEVIALLAIAALPTGRWFGVDAWFAASRERSAAKKAAA